jgi:hypothetical protein
MQRLVTRSNSTDVSVEYTVSIFREESRKAENDWGIEQTWSLAWLILRPSSWKEHVPSKRPLIVIGLHSFISQETIVHDCSFESLLACNADLLVAVV